MGVSVIAVARGDQALCFDLEGERASGEAAA